jgi:hypothetical protein
LQNKQETEHIYHQAGIEKAVYAYPDEAIVEMEPDEAGGDAGVVSDGVRHHLLDQRLGVGAAGVVEPHLQLAAGHRRQREAQQRDDRRHQHSTIHLLACYKHGAVTIVCPSCLDPGSIYASSLSPTGGAYYYSVCGLWVDDTHMLQHEETYIEGIFSSRLSP